MAQAERADAEMSTWGDKRRLHGIPLAHKDMFYRRDQVVTCGSIRRKNWRPPSDSTVLRRLEAEGAISLGTLNMSEFAYSPTGANNLVGAARNPWNPEYICGGSSSGSAAAVAAGLCLGALGSDTGGSVRIPAAICGVVGLMPTRGRVSRRGSLPLSFSLDCIGTLARTVSDAAVLLYCISGRDEDDPTTDGGTIPDFEAACDEEPRGLCVGVADRYFCENLDVDHQRAFDGALRVLERAGIRIKPVALPDMKQIVAAANVILGAESASIHARSLAAAPASYSEEIRARIENGFSYTAVEYIDALKFRSVALAQYAAATSGVDAVVTPTHGQGTPRLDQINTLPAREVTRLVANLSYWTRPINFLGVPALSVPAGLTGDGLPFGIQLVGKPFAEANLLSLAAGFERARGDFSLRREL